MVRIVDHLKMRPRDARRKNHMENPRRDPRTDRRFANCTRLFDGALVVRLADDIDLAARDDLRRAMLPLIDSPVAIIDVTDVTYTDTTLLNAIVRLAGQRLCAGNALPIRIAGANRQTRRIFTLTNVDRSVCFYDSMKPAIAAASRSNPPGNAPHATDPGRRAQSILHFLAASG